MGAKTILSFSPAKERALHADPALWNVSLKRDVSQKHLYRALHPCSNQLCSFCQLEEAFCSFSVLCSHLSALQCRFWLTLQPILCHEWSHSWTTHMALERNILELFSPLQPSLVTASASLCNGHFFPPAHSCCKTNFSSRTGIFPAWNATYAPEAATEALQWAARLAKTWGSHTPSRSQSARNLERKQSGKSGHTNKTLPLLQVRSTQPDPFNPAENPASTKSRSFICGEKRGLWPREEFDPSHSQPSSSELCCCHPRRAAPAPASPDLQPCPQQFHGKHLQQGS